MKFASLPSNPETRLKLGRAHVLALAGLVVLSLGIYLAASALTCRIGFPLDDAWIHQTYARSLALDGQWAFLPGRPSAGSTSPLWSALLAIGYWLGLAPYVWTFLLGGLALWGLALVAEKAARQLLPGYRPRLPWVGGVMILEWHLVWAAGSGMETMLFAALITAVLLVLSTSQRYILAGLLIAISIWVRPEGITLLGPGLFAAILVEASWPRRARAFGNLLMGFAALFVPYLLFNLALDGTPWPNTFYAKQAEYAVLTQAPLWKRYSQMFLPSLTGSGLALIPGVLFSVWTAIRRRQWGMIGGMVWFLGFLGMYAWRLPAIYQHGRYLIPVIPIYIFWGMLGLFSYMPKPVPRWLWTFDNAWRMLLITLLLLFWGMGAEAYGKDVAVIETEMVATAHWVAENVPADALVAAHDIGALGYFGGHELVDLAGLVSPEVIPFIRDESRLAVYLDERGVDYLVTFPDWYPVLTLGLTRVFTTEGGFAPLFEEMNMAVYLWPPP